MSAGSATLVKINTANIGTWRTSRGRRQGRSRSTRAFNPHTLIKTPCSPSLLGANTLGTSILPACARPATYTRGKHVREWWNLSLDRWRPADAPLPSYMDTAGRFKP